MRRMQLFAVFAFSLWLALAAHAQKDTITIWPKGIPPGGLKEHADFGNHLLEISHRETDGRAELHRKKADVMVIQSGTATLAYGGTVIDPVATGPNEIQGSGIRGAQKRTVAPGDIIEIPAGVPHQFFLAPGTQITYLVVKVNQP